MGNKDMRPTSVTRRNDQRAYQRGLEDGEAKGRREALLEVAEWHKHKADRELGSSTVHRDSERHFRQLAEGGGDAN